MSQTDPIILAAIDESPCLEAVVKRAGQLTECRGGVLLVAHVYPARSASLVNDESYGDLALHSAQQRDLQDSVELRARLEERLRAAGVSPTKLELLDGSAAQTLEDLVTRRGVSLLVLGRPKARLGSVATRLVKSAACDVHVVRTET